MKTVITKLPKDSYVLAGEVDPNKYYGIVYTLVDGTQSKAFITRESYRRGSYVSRCVSAINQGNSCCSCSTLDALIDYHLKQRHGVFEFDNETDLIKWLAT